MSCIFGKALVLSIITCKPFTKKRKRIQKFKETGEASYIYKNELAFFQHDMAYEDF